MKVRDGIIGVRWITAEGAIQLRRGLIPGQILSLGSDQWTRQRTKFEGGEQGVGWNDSEMRGGRGSSGIELKTRGWINRLTKRARYSLQGFLGLS